MKFERHGEATGNPRLHSMPLLLRIVMVILSLIVILGVPPATFILGVSAFSHGPFRVFGHTISEVEFRYFLVPLSTMGLMGCALALAASRGLYRERAWARPLLMMSAFLPSFVLTMLGYADDVEYLWLEPEFAVSFISPGLTWLYLFEKASVVKYYDSLRSRGPGGGEGPRSEGPSAHQDPHSSPRRSHATRPD